MRSMKPGMTTLERAFEIARSGGCNRVEEIRRQLAREGLDQHQITGRLLSRQLLEINRRSKGMSPEGN